MRQIVLDSNIIFRALHSANSSVRTTLSKGDCEFFAPNFLFVEIFKYKGKIRFNSKSTEEEILEYLVLLLQRVRFIPEDWVSLGCRIEAFRLCRDIDEKDTPFVALALDLDAELWTSDIVLKTGLLKKGFSHFFEEGQTKDSL